MVPGLGGHLVSEAFLETLLSTPGALDGDRAVAATILRAPGPHPRRPELKAAFRAPHPEARRSGLKAARADSHNVALLVAAWGERLDPLWRVAVTEAMRRFAPWGILFNGTHLRIVDPTRPYARRYLEFDLELAADDERAFARSEERR